MTSTTLPLPTISLTDRKNLSNSILEACTTSGFFYLTDHGLSASLIDSVFKTSSKLFLNSNLDSKLATIDRSNNVGYTPMMTESLDLGKPKAKVGDLKESFYLPRLIDQDQQHPHHLAPKVKLTEELKENRKDLEGLIEGVSNSSRERILICRFQRMRLPRSCFGLAFTLYFQLSLHSVKMSVTHC